MEYSLPPCDVCHCCSRLFKTHLQFNSPAGSGTPVKKVVGPRRHLGNENYNPMQISPVKQTLVSPSKFQAVRQLSLGAGRLRQPLEDYDPNSQDSGYGVSEDSKSTCSSSSSDFCFVQPNGIAPRRSNAESPRRSHVSTSSSDSTDDGFMDFISPLEDEEAQLPPALGSLISEPIINTGITSESSTFHSFRHCISDKKSTMLPVVEELPQEVGKKRCSTTLDSTPLSKRHKPLSDSNTPQQNTLFHYGFKRMSEPRPLLSHSTSLDERATPVHRPKFRHCLSESEAVIKNALHRSSEEELIGDFSRKFALPLINGAHQDLKSISPDTLAQLINGEFSKDIPSYQIIDCRYPYEYEGGHIRGAKNIYTKDHLIKEFLDSRPSLSVNNSDNSHNIIIFHCEFSSERGPGLSRFLRSKDRERNAYPALHYPELYLLEGGYKAFYNTHKELCEPCAYRKMVDADKGELQHFRAKSKTWSGDKTQRVLKRSTSFKRLGL